MIIIVIVIETAIVIVIVILIKIVIVIVIVITSVTETYWKYFCHGSRKLNREQDREYFLYLLRF